jgi:hypothetical protein
MSGFLTERESRLISRLKRDGTLRRFTVEELNSLTNNGGVAIICSDGDIDASRFHRKFVARPHEKKDFGGFLLLCKSFKGYDETRAKLMLENIAWGMEAKSTSSIFPYPHWPCGVGSEKYGHTLEEMINMIPEGVDVLNHNPFFSPPKITVFFHVKRINKGGKAEQNSYICVK